MLRNGSQNYIVWQYLKEHGEINDDTCRQIGGGKRLAARIWELRNREHKPILDKDVYRLAYNPAKKCTALYKDRVYYLEGLPYVKG